MQLTQQRSVNTFAGALREARERAGLSQRGLAKRCGLTPAYMSLLEGGRRMPERPTVERIADALALDGEGRVALLLAAGYAAASALPAAPPGPLAEVDAMIAGPGFTSEQREQMLMLIRLYAQGLAARARTGKPLVSDLAAPWQQRILETMQEQMAEDFDSFRDSFMRPSFDL